MPVADDKNIKQTTIFIQDLCCTVEELKIRKRFEAMEGVRSFQVDFVSHRLSIQHSTTDERLLTALRSIGLPGITELNAKSRTAQRSVRRQRMFLGIAIGLFASGILLQLTSLPSVVSNAVILAAVAAGGWEVALKALRSITRRSLDINVLMTVAFMGAIALGQYFEAAAVIILYALSLLLESMSIDRTRHAVRSLMKLSPLTACVFRDGHETTVPTDRLAIGDEVRVRPGERIPADGTVIGGASTVDQSTITGESVPVVRTVGDAVFAGTFNQRGTLNLRVERLSQDSRLSQIVHLVEEAESKRADHHTFVERFARLYTPAVFVLALSIWLVPPVLLHQPFSEWFYRGLVLLVISCPCALVISTPVTLVSAITNAARHGILIKGGKHLESLATVKALAIDKTGTLTQARLEVIEVIGLEGTSRHDVLQIAASLELRSEHHLADALLQKAAESGSAFRDNVVEQFEALPGRGVRGIVNGRPYAVGNHHLAEELRICSPEIELMLEGLENHGRTVIILSDEQQAIGIIAFADSIREESKLAIESLHRLGVRPIVLLTGDNATAAASVATELGVDEVRSGLLPTEKSKAVHELRERHGSVGMVGDGVNDAPALASATVGIAMGAAGSDTAIEAADIVLMSDNLRKVPHGIALGRKSIRVIEENIALALAVKGVFVLLGILGWTSLWLAILADDGVTLVVILNSLRILWFKSES